MILQALMQYYERKFAADPDVLPPEGFERRHIPFVIVLSEDGHFLNLEDTREGTGKQARARSFLVPQAPKRTQAVVASLLWDKGEYVLGVPSKKSKKKSAQDPARLQAQFTAFKHRIQDIFGDQPDDPGVAAVLRFLEARDFSPLFAHPLWQSGEAGGDSYFTFRLACDSCLVLERPAVVSAIRQSLTQSDAPEAQCLVTGQRAPIAVTHPPIRGLPGAQPTGANIVSFNLDAFCSHGLSQGANAPVSRTAAFAYTTALNALLDSESSNKARAGATTVVFWSAAETPLESLAAALFGDDSNRLNDPDSGVAKLRAIFAAPWHGYPPLRDDYTPFFVLGLSPNASRIAIRFWLATTVSSFASHVLTYFDDISITRPPFAPPYPTLGELLRSLSPQGERDKIPPNLAGDFLRAILQGTPYPATLLDAAVRRCRAERHVPPARAALIKAYLLRALRFHHSTYEEATVALDVTNTNVGYLLGRLFAVLERAQEKASPDVKATIRDRYYGAASATPVSVFPTLMKLKNHHLAKIEDRGTVVHLERLIGSILDSVRDFPHILRLHDQARFALGYYHQRQAFFHPQEKEN